MANSNCRTLSVSFSSQFADQPERMAEEQGKTTGELLREAFRTYQLEQLRHALKATQEEFRHNNPLNYTEADVERLIDEYRAEEAVVAQTE